MLASWRGTWLLVNDHTLRTSSLVLAQSRGAHLISQDMLSCGWSNRWRVGKMRYAPPWSDQYTGSNAFAFSSAEMDNRYTVSIFFGKHNIHFTSQSLNLAVMGAATSLSQRRPIGLPNRILYTFVHVAGRSGFMLIFSPIRYVTWSAYMFTNSRFAGTSTSASEWFLLRPAPAYTRSLQMRTKVLKTKN